MNKLKAILLGLMSILMLITVGMADTSPIQNLGAQLNINPSDVQNIKMGTIGHYSLTLTTSTDAKGGKISWEVDNSLILVGINGIPTSNNGSYTITSHSICIDSDPNIDSDSKSPKSKKICTQTFDLQVQPRSGIKINKVYRVDVLYKDIQKEAKLRVTAGTAPIPESSTGILTLVGLIYLVGFVIFGNKNQR